MSSSIDTDKFFEKNHMGYSGFLEKLDAEAVFEGLLGFGMFADKVPPILTSEYFFNHRKASAHMPESGQHDWISFRYMRNVNQFREFGIPNPFAYELLVREIVKNWDNIKALLKDATADQPYRISRIHPRKLATSRAVFSMNYKNWKTDADPLPAILIGKRYLVRCDISKCFPSIYTHAVDWAIEGRREAKTNKKIIISRGQDV